MALVDPVEYMHVPDMASRSAQQAVEMNIGGVYGNSVVLNAGEGKQVIRVDKLKSPGLHTVTVHYAPEGRLSDDPAVLDGLEYTMYCDMAWGIGGSRQSITFDISQGVRLVVPAEGITLSATYPAGPLGAGFTYQPRVRVSALIAPGGAGASTGQFGGVRRTFYVTMTEAGGFAPTTAETAVPPFASCAYFYASTLALLGTSVLLRQINGPAGVSNTYRSTTLCGLSPVPLMNGMPIWYLENTLAAAVTGHIVFPLML